MVAGTPVNTGGGGAGRPVGAATNAKAPCQPGSGESSESAWPELVPPFEQPKDSRVVLSGRCSALEQKVQGLAGKEEDPPCSKAQELLQKAREEINAAGGRTR